MGEYNPYASLVPGYAADFAGADFQGFPAISGASPGPLDPVAGFVGSIIGNEFGPLVNFIGNQLSTLERSVWASANSALSLVTRLGFRWALVALGWLLPPVKLDIWRQWQDNPYFSAGDLLAAMFEMLWQAIETAKGWGLQWLRDRVNEGLGMARYAQGTLADVVVQARNDGLNWIGDRLNIVLGMARYGQATLADVVVTARNDSLAWISDRLNGVLGYGAYGFGSLFQGIERRAGDWSGWVRDRVSELLGLGLWGYSTLLNGFNTIFWQGTNWLRDRVSDGLGFARYGFTNLADLIARKITDSGAWIYENVGRPIIDEVRKVGLAVVGGAQDIAGFFAEGLERVLLGPIEIVGNLVESKLGMLDRMARGQYPDGFALINDLLDPPPEINRGFTGVLLIPLIALSVATGLMGAFGPIYWEGPRQEILRNLSPTLLTNENVLEAWNRDFISEGEATDELRRRGFGGSRLAAMQKLRYRLPPLTDLTRMAVREVFDPAQRSALTLDADYPAALTAPAKALGLEEVWARNYWAAHWDLPSPTQGYEMLHRGIISEQQLADLLRALDYAPVWRGRLRDISYNPLTRVDVRRMYAAGVIDLARVKRAYLDIGYNDANATALTEFTKRNYAPGDKTTGVVNRELTAGVIRQSYRRHIITRDDALRRLIEAGYDAEESDFQLDLDDATLATNALSDSAPAIRDLTVATIRQAYRERIYTRPQAITELGILGYTGAEAGVMLALDDLQVTRALRDARAEETRVRYVSRAIEYAAALAELTALGIPQDHAALKVAEWGAEKRAGERKLTVADVFRALNSNVFSTDQAMAYLLKLGYNDADAGVLMRLRAGG